MKNLEKKSPTELITIIKQMTSELVNYQSKTKRIIQKKNEVNAQQKSQIDRLYAALNDVNEQLKKFVDS